MSRALVPVLLFGIAVLLLKGLVLRAPSGSDAASEQIAEEVRWAAALGLAAVILFVPTFIWQVVTVVAADDTKKQGALDEIAEAKRPKSSSRPFAKTGRRAYIAIKNHGPTDTFKVHISGDAPIGHLELNNWEGNSNGRLDREQGANLIVAVVTADPTDNGRCLVTFPGPNQNQERFDWGTVIPLEVTVLSSADPKIDNYVLRVGNQEYAVEFQRAPEEG